MVDVFLVNWQCLIKDTEKGKLEGSSNLSLPCLSTQKIIVMSVLAL